MAEGPVRRPWLVLVVALAAVVLLLLWWQQGGGASPGDDGRSAATATTPASSAAVDPDSGLPWIDESELPPEAAHTLELIDSGGPYPYDRDDAVFSNREGLLPDRPEGYYREYTVETPGSDDRGARRVVAGSAGEYYWTDDHYQSFSRIAR